MGAVNHRIRRVKADSLLETVIAAVLIVVVFGIAMMVYNNVLRASRPVKQVRASAVLRQLAGQIEHGDSSFTSSLQLPELTVHVSLLPNGTSGLKHLHLSATDAAGDTIARLNKLIIDDEK